MTSTADSIHPCYPNVEKDEDLWFPDANIVIVASGARAFRVYKGMLARMAPVFKTTLEFREDGETMEGVPVITVYDTAIDLKHFLEVALNPAVEYAPPSRPARLSH